MKKGLRNVCVDLLALILIVAFSFGLGYWVRSGKQSAASDERYLQHPAVSISQLQGYLLNGKVCVVDARPASEFARGHIPGALSMPTEGFDSALESFVKKHPDRDVLVVVYCENSFCALADDLQQQLIDHGYRHVGLCRDGWAGWMRAGLPTEVVK